MRVLDLLHAELVPDLHQRADVLVFEERENDIGNVHLVTGGVHLHDWRP